MRLTVRADGFEGWARRGRERAEKLARGEKIAAEKTINFGSALEMRRVLTVERMRLLEATRKQAFSVTGLAAVLKRDPKSVRRDVLKLVQVGVLRTREEINPGHGRVKIVEPVAKRVEMRASF
jgi:predicted transcriptional regulator